jgi:hypothetical protein
MGNTALNSAPRRGPGSPSTSLKAATAHDGRAPHPRVDDATYLGFIRAGSEYRAEKITTAAVNDAIDNFNGLLAALPPVFAKTGVSSRGELAQLDLS